jgi:hypothetical protein
MREIGQIGELERMTFGQLKFWINAVLEFNAEVKKQSAHD